MKTTKKVVPAVDNTDAYDISNKDATKDMDRIKKEFKYYKLGITPELAEAVNSHVKEYGIGQIWNHFGDADGGDPVWWDWRNRRVYKLKLKPAEWVPVR